MSRWTQRPKRSEPSKVRMPDPGIPLEPGEETSVWAFAEFATGIAPPVKGRRWFRDPQGRDIEPLLEQQGGWPHREGPTGPPGAQPTDWRDTTAKAVGASIKVAQTIAGVATSAAGGLSGAGDIDLGPAKKYMDPAIEFEDFPVMVAGPGSVAGSVPWQLDPARRPADYQVLMSLTSRRFLLTHLQTPGGEWSLGGLMETLPRQLIWQVPRQRIAGVEQRKYSENEADTILRFTDGSWIRVNFQSSGTFVRLQEALSES